MRYRLQLRKIDWRYAIGEILLIIVGVTIALAATSWYEEKKLRQDEQLALSQLLVSLTDDLAQIRRQLDQMLKVEADLQSLVNWYASDSLPPDDLPALFGSLGSWRSVTIKTAPFEAIKSYNFELVSDATLRMALIEFYEDTYSNLLRNSEIDRDFVRARVWDVLSSKFDQSGGVRANEWSPRDIEAVRLDATIENLAKWRIRSLNSFLFRDYRMAIEQIQGILDLINRQIESGQ